MARIVMLRRERYTSGVMNPTVNARQHGTHPWTLILLFLTALALVLVACNGDDDIDDTPTVTETPEVEEEPEEGGSLIVALPQEPEVLNFTLTTTPAAHWILSSLDSRMIRIDADNEMEPQLLREVPTLENGGISEDGLTYTIRFLPDLTWSDGEPVTAHDFLFTWATVTHPDYPAATMRGWNLIDDVTVSTDGLSAVIRLRSSSADFVTRVLAGASGEGSGFLLPAHLFEDVEPAQIPGHEYGASSHVGSGPFQLVEWEPGEQIIVERNDTYWGEPPLLDRIVFRFPESPRDAVTLVTTGDVDLSVYLPETALLDALESEETEVLITPRAGAVKTFAFNLNDPDDLDEPHPVFGDQDVRMAIALGFDRWSVVRSILLDQTTVPATPLSNTKWEHEGLEPAPYDPERAAELLDAAGWTLGDDGFRSRRGTRLAFTITTVSGDDAESVLRQRVQQAFIDDMAELGILVEPRNVAAEQLVGTTDDPGVVPRREFDIVDLQWNSRTTLDMFIERFAEAFIPDEEYPQGANVMGYRSEEVNRLIREQATMLDPDNRAATLAEAQEIIMDDVPVVLIYDHIEIDMARVYVHGLRPGPVTGLWWNVEEWWISREEVLT
jgi:peptide/nickel transport system substrate-binding protein